ncbi:MAG: ATP-dependent DNA helicase [Deltaproteobacteria bacterium]|nr:ATP-dependent DNA helicase [Deltaproteobacteria bacterium]
MTVETMLGQGGALSRVLRGYEARAEQGQMAAAVERALSGGNPLLVEAGTGTGKSLAYLIPAAKSGLRVVVSTATKALGEQIMQRDLPTLAKLGLNPSVALVKGLSNYLCLRRLDEHRRAVISGTARADMHLDAVIRWAENTASGDRADLESVPEDSMVWRDVASSSDTRLGVKCRFYEQCFSTRMRRRAEASQIIVTNHHLFCADLALRHANIGAQVLPDYDAVIFDEAHALEEVATEFFGVRVMRSRAEAIVRDANRAFETAGFFVDPTRRSSLGRVLADILSANIELFTLLPRLGARGRATDTFDRVLMQSGRVLLDAEVFEGPFGEATRALSNALTRLSDSLRDFVGGGDALLSVARRTQAMRDAMVMILGGSDGTQVVYGEADSRGGGTIGVSPIEVGPLLRERLWSRRTAVVLTSATLASGANGATKGFEFVRARLGVPSGADELALASPFDYGLQSALYVPRKIPEPREDGYFDAAVQEIRALVEVTRGGAFVLCTSHRQMKAFAQALRGTWPYATLVQGESPKQALLTRFRAAGDAVLFATSSFWEGVDVPGRALRLVVMDKLPFEAPNDPVVAARIARLKSQGHEPFVTLQVPAATLALKQGFGRLIRTRHDAGIVAILDRRLYSKGYGRTMLDALPPASRCNSLDELRAFWMSVDQG